MDSSSHPEKRRTCRSTITKSIVNATNAVATGGACSGPPRHLLVYRGMGRGVCRHCRDDCRGVARNELDYLVHYDITDHVQRSPASERILPQRHRWPCCGCLSAFARKLAPSRLDLGLQSGQVLQMLGTNHPRFEVPDHRTTMRDLPLPIREATGERP